MKSFIVQKNDFFKEALFTPENKVAELIKLWNFHYFFADEMQNMYTESLSHFRAKTYRLEHTIFLQAQWICFEEDKQGSGRWYFFNEVALSTVNKRLQKKYVPTFGSWKGRGMKMVSLNNSVIIFLSTLFVNQKSIYGFFGFK